MVQSSSSFPTSKRLPPLWHVAWRKSLSEKCNNEEMRDTINRLLKKQAAKRRGRVSAAETASAGAERPDAAIAGMGEGIGSDMSMGEEGEMIQKDPMFVMWVCDRRGFRVDCRVSGREGCGNGVGGSKVEGGEGGEGR